jgi:dipeptidyl aminopeptidase/acylaminoacyl peptidase
VPYAQSVAFERALEKLGTHVTFITGEKAPHVFRDPKITEAMRLFVRQQLLGEKELEIKDASYPVEPKKP